MDDAGAFAGRSRMAEPEHLTSAARKASLPTAPRARAGVLEPMGHSRTGRVPMASQ